MTSYLAFMQDGDGDGSDDARHHGRIGVEMASPLGVDVGKQNARTHADRGATAKGETHPGERGRWAARRACESEPRLTGRPVAARCVASVMRRKQVVVIVLTTEGLRQQVIDRRRIAAVRPYVAERVELDRSMAKVATATGLRPDGAEITVASMEHAAAPEACD